MTRSALRIILMGSMLALPACHRKASVPAPAQSAKADDLSKSKQGEGNGTGAGVGANADEDTDSSTSRYHEATVYVDGVPRIAFTYNEMPSTVKVYEYTWSEDYPDEKAHHMLVADYVKALGVDLAKVKELHWYGGRDRVVILTGDELRKYKDKLFFQFTRDMFGKPRTEWRTNVMVNDHIDVVSDLAIYVDKKPPRWDKELWSLVDDRGEPIDKTIPYCQEEMPRRSVRVNVDGRFVAYMKRNLLEGNLHPLNGDKDGNVPAGVLPIYKLNELLSSRKQPATGFKGIDLITGEERIVRLSADEAKDITFSLKRHGGGVAEIFWQGHNVEAKAVNVYVGTPVPTRPHRTLTLGHQARIGGGDSHSRQEKGQ
jgi:hypothetical protein